MRLLISPDRDYFMTNQEEYLSKEKKKTEESLDAGLS